MYSTRTLVFLFAAALTACDHGSSSTAPAGSAASSSSAVPPASAAPAGSAVASSAAGAAAVTYAGTYTSKPGTIFVPDGGEWKGVKWRGDDDKSGLGDGALSLAIKDGRIDGTLEGPLGPAVVSGSIAGDDVMASIARKDPKDEGFTGTLVGKRSGDGIEGDMTLSQSGTGHVLRQASFKLAKKP